MEVATRRTTPRRRPRRAAAPSAASGMNEPLNAPLGSVEDELRFALGGDVDVQLFDGDIDEALRSAAGGECDGSVCDPFASRPGSPLDLHGAGDCGASAIGFGPRDPFQSDERYGHAAASADQPYLGLSRLVSMPGDDGFDGPTYVPLNDAAPGAGDNMDPPSAPDQSELDYELAAGLLQDDALLAAASFHLGESAFGDDGQHRAAASSPRGGQQWGAPGPAAYGHPPPAPPEVDHRRAYRDRFHDVSHQLDRPRRPGVPAPLVHVGTIPMTFRTNLMAPVGTGAGGGYTSELLCLPPAGPAGAPRRFSGGDHIGEFTGAASGAGAGRPTPATMPNLLEYDRFLAPAAGDGGGGVPPAAPRKVTMPDLLDYDRLLAPVAGGEGRAGPRPTAPPAAPGKQSAGPATGKQSAGRRPAGEKKAKERPARKAPARRKAPKPAPKSKSRAAPKSKAVPKSKPAPKAVPKARTVSGTAKAVRPKAGGGTGKAQAGKKDGKAQAAVPKTAPKTAPKAVPKSKPVPKPVLKAAPKAVAKTAPKAAPKAVPKTAPRAVPKAKPVAKVAPKAVSKAAPKAAPKAVPKTAPKAVPKTAKASGPPAKASGQPAKSPKGVPPKEGGPPAGPSAKVAAASDSTATEETPSPDEARKGEEEEKGEAPGAPPPVPSPPSGEAQRLARSRRRRLRARCQVVDRLGGLREIRRRAVEDSDLGRRRSPAPAALRFPRWAALAGGALGYTTSRPPAPCRDELLRSFAEGLDASAYVAGVSWEAVREGMAAAKPPPASDEAPPAAPDAAGPPGGGEIPAAGGAPAVVSPPAPPGAAASAGLPAPAPPGPGGGTKRKAEDGAGTDGPPAPVVRGPNGRKMRVVQPKLHGVDLPTGTDPETRRQRRLMRNRLTAQASRDRKRKAIEEARRARDEREVEIKALRRTLRDESERLRSLESMLDLARRSMSQEQFARVTGMSTANGMATAISSSSASVSSSSASSGPGASEGADAGAGGPADLHAGVATGV